MTPVFHHGDRPVVLGTRKRTTMDAAPAKLDLNKSAGVARPSSVANGKAVRQPEPQRERPSPLSMQRAVQPVPQRAVQPVPQRAVQPAALAGVSHTVELNLGSNARLVGINGADFGAMSEAAAENGMSLEPRVDRLETAVAILARGEEATSVPVATKVELPAPSTDRALLRAAISETRWARQQYDTNLRVNRLNEANAKHYAARAQRDEQARRQ